VISFDPPFSFRVMCDIVVPKDAPFNPALSLPPSAILFPCIPFKSGDFLPIASANRAFPLVFFELPRSSFRFFHADTRRPRAESISDFWRIRSFVLEVLSLAFALSILSPKFFFFWDMEDGLKNFLFGEVSFFFFSDFPFQFSPPEQISE